MNFADSQDATLVVIGRVRPVADGQRTTAGKVITTAGRSAGIDGTVYLFERQLGKKQAEGAASYMEYHWKLSAS